MPGLPGLWINCQLYQSCCQRLGLRREQAIVEVTGLAAKNVGVSKGKVDFTFMSRFKSPNRKSFSQSALVLPRMTCKLPVARIQTSKWDHIASLNLADPNFNQPGHVDILLGAGVFLELLRAERRPGSNGSPSCVESHLGWLVVGNYNGDSPTTVRVHHALADLTEVLQTFWELEAIPNKKPSSHEEKSCEQHFLTTHTRDPTGRFVVKLPFKMGSKPLGTTREIALSRLLHNERKLSNRPHQQQQYKAFMQECVSLGHMEKITSDHVPMAAGSCY